MIERDKKTGGGGWYCGALLFELSCINFIQLALYNGLEGIKDHLRVPSHYIIQTAQACLTHNAWVVLTSVSTLYCTQE